MLKRRGIKHEVLNAKNHTREAAIVAQAGKFGAVTIATNMAGRGTDIILGGNAEFLAKAEMAKQGISDEIIAESVGFADTDNEEIISARALFNELMIKFKAQVEEERAKVVSAGGLMIIGTERHESRRIDNQLRGRAGRQGDPGETRFYISFEDDLMRKFIPQRILEMAMKAQENDDEPIEMQMFTNAIERAQKAVEGRNFQTRKHVLEYDDVMNKQREVIYGQRQKVLDGEDIRDTVLRMIESAVEEMVDLNCAGGEFPDDWNLRGIEKEGTEIYSVEGKEISFANEDMNYLTREKIKDMVREAALEKYAEKETLFGEGMREVERVVLLRTVDQKWIDHIDDMDQLRHGITLRAYGQKNPVTEYQVEGFNMFEEMIASISRDTAKTILNVYPAQKLERKQVAVPLRESRSSDSGVKQPVKKATKVGRNDPCPCGSGKKYKKCCGFDGQD